MFTAIKVSTMRGLLSIIATFSFIALAQSVNNCTKEYYSVNTFKTQKLLTFSCLEHDLDCEVYYSPPGNGCDGTRTLLGTVARNDAQVFAGDFELGGGFCSDVQFTVYAASDSDGRIIAHLPRATEAGTMFHQAVTSYSVKAAYQCVVSALESSTYIMFDDEVEEGKLEWINRYESYKFDFDMNPDSVKIIQLESEHPVILSCVEISQNKMHGIEDVLVTLPPVSSERVFAFSDYVRSVVSILIIDCKTNRLVPDITKAEVSIGQTHGSFCKEVQEVDLSHGMQRFYFKGHCAVLVKPAENYCVSVSMQSQQNKYLAAAGIPESKFSTQFPSNHHQPSNPYLHNTYAYSFSKSTCKGYVNETYQEVMEMEEAGGYLAKKVAEVDFPQYYQYAWVECDEPTLILAYNYPYLTPFLAGYQTLDLWKPFLAECSGAP